MGRRQQGQGELPDVKPLDVDGVRTVAIVTVLWGVGFVVLALRQGALNDAGNGWWLWTCLAGVGLGLLGLEYCRKRRDAIAQAALEAEAAAPDDEDDWTGVGDWSQLPEEPDDDFRYATDEHEVLASEGLADAAQPTTGEHITMPYSPVGQGGEPHMGRVSSPPTPAPPPVAPLHATQPPSQPLAARSLGQAPQSDVPGSPEQARQRPAQAPSAAPPLTPPRMTPPPPPPPQAPVSPPTARVPDEAWPSAADPGPHSTGTWHAAPAGYSPEPEKSKRHPRDREVASRPSPAVAEPVRQPEPFYDVELDRSTPSDRLPFGDSGRPSRPAHGQPASSPGPRPVMPAEPVLPDASGSSSATGGGGPTGRRRSKSDEGSVEFSEFFDDVPPPRARTLSDTDFLLDDLADGPIDGRGRDEGDDEEYRGRRARRSS